jgi:hypothetical protein
MMRRSDGESGAAAVEFAVMLPLLLALLGGVLELGTAAIVRARIQDAVEEGAIQAARAPGNQLAAVTRTVEASNGVLKPAEVWLTCPDGDVRIVAIHDHARITGFLPIVPDPMRMRIDARTARLSSAACVPTSPAPPAE